MRKITELAPEVEPETVAEATENDPAMAGAEATESHSGSHDDPGSFPGDADDREPVEAGPAEGCVSREAFRERFMGAGDFLGGAMVMRFGLLRELRAFNFRADPLSPQVADTIYAMAEKRKFLRWLISDDVGMYGAAAVIFMWGANRFNALRAELPAALEERERMLREVAQEAAPEPPHHAAANDNEGPKH